MGWGSCGLDSQGRSIGYNHEATCDFPGCTEKIHRGLDYACGGMHGDDEISCEKYFCYAHHVFAETKPDGPTNSQGLHCITVCPDCYKHLKAEGLLVDEGEGEEEDAEPPYVSTPTPLV